VPRVVTIPLICTLCQKPFEVACEPMPGTSQTTFYRIDCPHCAAVNHPHLPGTVVDVLRADEERDTF
jgi:hypothetical protein